VKYNFDELINRENTSCYKYDLKNKYFDADDLLPMWVADMDFNVPDCITDAIRQRLSHKIFGYSFYGDTVYESIINWLHKRHRWQIKKEWIGYTPGVVPALNLAVLAFSDPGDKIIVQTPVYFPFYSAVKDHKRILIQNPLKPVNGRYEMDLDNLRKQIDDKTRILFLCSPHNPTGNVWKKEELEDLASICLEKGILIVSDEIHADIVYKPHNHIPTASLTERISDQVITLMAPSKTFNVAGLSTSYFITSNAGLKAKMNRWIEKMHLSMGNIFGSVALEAAYTKGDAWLDQLLSYLSGNIRLTKEFINNDLNGITLVEPEATFLLWLDFREKNVPPEQLNAYIQKKAGLALSDGLLFGSDGKGFQRINIGCPRSILEKALTRLKHAFG
jgi:cystathionine beta-lyase